MKARFYLLAAALLSLVSCNEPAEVEEFSLKADPASLTFAAAGAASQQIKVSSENVVWTASLEEECDWIELSVNDDLITVTVSDNETYEARSNRIAISSDIESVETVYVSVAQDGMEKPEAIRLKADAMATYYGMDFMYSTNFNGEWLLNFYTEDSDIEIKWAEFGKDGYWSGSISNGREIALYLYCDLSEDYFHPLMVSGEYTPCPSNYDIENMTFTLSQENPNGLPWPDGSYIADYSNGTPQYIFITDGKVKVETDGTSYQLDILLTLEDGSEVAYSYSGEPKLSLLGNPPYYSDLDEDLVLETDDFSDVYVSSYELSLAPDYTQWSVQLLGEGVTIDDNGTVTGEGIYGSLQMFSLTSDSKDGFPEGTYVIDENFNPYDPYEFGALAGAYNPVMGNSGCYFDNYSSDSVVFAPLSEGTIKVTNIGEGSFRFEISGKDDNNHNITVVYEGAVTIR